MKKTIKRLTIALLMIGACSLRASGEYRSYSPPVSPGWRTPSPALSEASSIGHPSSPTQPLPPLPTMRKLEAELGPEQAAALRETYGLMTAEQQTEVPRQILEGTMREPRRIEVSRHALRQPGIAGPGTFRPRPQPQVNMTPQALVDELGNTKEAVEFLNSCVALGISISPELEQYRRRPDPSIISGAPILPMTDALGYEGYRETVGRPPHRSW